MIFLCDVVIYFLRGGFGQLPETNSCTAKTAEKKPCKGSHRRKNQASAFYYPGAISDVKKFLHKLLPTK